MPSQWVGPYEVLRKLGSGGMGTVYLALDDDGRTVAVKVIHPHVAEDTNGMKRLAREVAAMKRVRSPYVSELIDADLHTMPPYIVTRYVQGRSLQQIVERRGPLPDEAVRKLGVGLMAALDAIHGVDVVHRDLTPRNVMMADGVPIVIDFGIAQAFDATRITQNFMGTPGYVAPEVIQGERARPPADIFSWAATVVFAATARQCFGGKTIMETLYRTLNTEPDLTGVPQDIAPGLWRSLRKDPAERPLTGLIVAGISAFYPEMASLLVAPQQDTSASRVSGLWVSAGEALEKGQFELAEKLYADVRQLAVRAREPHNEMWALYQLGSVTEIRGEYEAARKWYERAQQIAESTRDGYLEALALRGLERLAYKADDTESARRYAEQVQRVLDERYQKGYPEPPEGAGNEHFPVLRWWQR